MIQKLSDQTAEYSQLKTWVPMPRYLLRSFVVKRIVRRLAPKNFIEIGAASGHMVQWLSQKQGMTGTAVEISPPALNMMHERLDGDPNVRIYDKDSTTLDAEADILISTEVLEHIEDDLAALKNWYDLIRPGGHLLLSVPAHPSMFSAEDEMAGHYRRYSRIDLIDKLKVVGFKKPKILCYGFPLGLLLKFLRTKASEKKIRTDARNRQQRTEASGVERKRWVSMRWVLNDLFMLPCNLIQLPFMHFDLGDGYIAIARKPENTDV